MDTNVIEVKDVSKRFAGIQALKNVNFNLKKGEVHVLLGENGAGKSTLIKIILGVYQKDSGQIFFEGKEVSFASPIKSAELGICAIYQELSLIPNLDIGCNIYLGRFPLKKGKLIDWDQVYKNAGYILEDLQLKLSPRTKVSQLSASQKQMLEIGRALFFKGKVIIMDEPTSSLNDEEVKDLFQKIKLLKQKGISIIYITHKLQEIFEIGDRVTVLRDGEVISTKYVKDVSIDTIIKEMIGRELESGYPKIEVPIGDVVLEVNSLSRGKTVNNCSFKLRRGEILGLAGLVGSGRTEIVRALFGIDRPDNIEVKLDNKPIQIKSPNDSINQGIVLLPEERKTQGILGLQSIWRNICISAINCRRLAKQYRRFNGTLIKKKMLEAGEKYKKSLDIKTESLDRQVRHLSGGNQQKVVLARALNTEPKVVMLDEPTKGIDVAAKAEVFKIVGKLAASGVGIILISSEHQEILSMSDRILVVNSGRIAGELNPKIATQEDILRLSVI